MRNEGDAIQKGCVSVSVVIPLYNRHDLIKRTVDSVLNQTYRDFELVVIDDGSTDGGGDVVRQYKDPRVRVITQANGGECAARNRGIIESHGEWIALLDSDDEWMPGFLDAVVKVAKAEPALAAVFTNIFVVGCGHPHFMCALEKPTVLDDYFAFCADHHGRGITSSSVLIRRQVLNDIGGFPVGIHRSGDTETWVRLGLAGDIACVPEVLAVFHNETQGSATLFPQPVFPQGVVTIRRLRAEGRIPERFAASLSRLENIQLLQHVRGLIEYRDRVKAAGILFRECSWRRSPTLDVLKALGRLLVPRRSRGQFSTACDTTPARCADATSIGHSRKQRQRSLAGNSLHVSLFVPNLCGGGAERVMVHLANGLASRQMKVDLVLAEATGPYLTDVANAVRVVDLHSRRVMKAILPLARYLRHEKPDSLITALTHANAVALMARCLSLSSIPTITTIQNVARPARKIDKAHIAKIFSHWACRHSDAVVADSYGTAEQIVTIAGIPQQLIHTIYNPVISARMMDMAKMSVKHPFFDEQSAPVILAVGRLSPVKDFATLIRAFALLRREIVCRLIILGEGIERTKLEKLAEELNVAENISMPGFADNPYAYMAKASLFALSSLQESMSMVLVEALAIGLPVVATNCDFGPREILQNGRYGRLVSVGDAQGLANAMQCALSEPRCNVPPEALRPFDGSVAIDQYADLIQTLVRRRRDE